MNSLTLQILILIASFLFYRVLRSGFESWTAVLIDFGIVIFLFALQYFLQKRKTPFPSGEMSRLFGVSFPDKLTLEEESQKRNLGFLEIKDNMHIEPNQKINLLFDTSTEIDSIESRTLIPHTNQTAKITQSGIYMIQITIQLDKVPFHAKFSIIGQKNNIVKSVHDGENSFIVFINGEDEIHFEIENSTKPCMILSKSCIYLVEL